jgi:hypothetical protein
MYSENILTSALGIKKRRKTSETSFRKNKNKLRKLTDYSSLYTKNYKFDIYLGFRWSIPSGIKVSSGVKYKFQLLDTYSPSAIIKYINNELNNKVPARLSFNGPQWSPLIFRRIFQSNRTKELNEWMKVKIIYNKLFRFCIILKSLIHRRRINICLRNCKNTDDIVTMELPKKPVYIIDFLQKCSYIYDATSIRKSIESRLMLSDYMFPEPQDAVNLLTNQVFTISQYISAINQCRAHNETSWILDRFKSCGYSLKKFSLHFKQQLKLNAIEAHFSGDFEKCKVSVIDFFELHADRLNIPFNKLIAFRNLCNTSNKHSIINQWRKLTSRYYIATELKDDVEHLIIILQSEILLEKFSHVINLM